MVEIVSNPRVMEHVGMKRKVENGGKRGKGQRDLITSSDRRRKSKRERERERDCHRRTQRDGNALRQNWRAKANTREGGRER